MMNKIMDGFLVLALMLGTAVLGGLVYFLFNSTRPIEVRRIDQNCIQKTQGPFVDVVCHPNSNVNNNFDMVPHD
jgi:hypothetical protein